MRILTLTTSYPEGPDDYRGGFVAALESALADRGHEITTATPGPGSLYHGDGVVETLRRRPWLGIQLPGGLLRLTLEGLRGARRCDAILSHWLLPAGLIGAALRRMGVPRHVLVVHGGGLRALETLPRPVAGKLLAWVAEGTHRVQAVAPRIATRLATHHPPLAGRIDVDPMGVPLSPNPAPAPTPRSLRVLVVGRLVPRKGVQTLLDAAGQVPGVSVTVVGDGPARAPLAARARPHGAPVRFLGEQAPRAVTRLYPEHHVIAAPSLPYPTGGEGTPTAVLGAMSAGLVPVASRTGGLADLLDAEECGLLHRPGDAPALAAALRRLRDHPDAVASLAASARGRAREQTWSQVAARVEARLIGARSRVA